MTKHLNDLNAPVVMGILNVTPDSFSDGGHYFAVEPAVEQALAMVEQGASIIDIGGESTRPGAAAVPVEVELERILPVIEALRQQSAVTISIDTSKPAVMRAAVKAGANMINDVAALSHEDAIDTVVELRVPVCLMHMQGQPRTMQQSPDYPLGVVNEVRAFLAARIEAAVTAGLDRSLICIDPGFGFGKTLQHNYELLSQLSEFQSLDLPIMVGVSRKSMIGNLLQLDVGQRLPGSLAAVVMAMERGATIFRVHDVAATVQALSVVSACLHPENIVINH